MNLTRDVMLDRFLARDAAYDGRFITGVLTTGIYCLPSCTARKPLAVNVTFFTRPEEAKAAGLRPCLRCRPDAFYEGRDPDRERLEAALGAMRAAPAEFAGVADIAKRAFAGVRKLNQLVRTHYHTTPAVLLVQARLAAAQRLLDGGARVIDAAYDAGFDSLSAFNENFRRWTGLRPRDWPRLGDTGAFVLALPRGFRPAVPLRIHGRDAASPTERVTGQTLHRVLRVDGRTAHLSIELDRGRARCRIDVDGPVGQSLARAAHSATVRMLGLAQDPAPFERRAARTAGARALVDGRAGTRIPLTADPFDALVWCIVGQQVNLAFAYRLRRALIELAGAEAGGGLRAHPTPADVARLDYGDLTRERYSRRKAEYLIDSARAVVSGELRLNALAARPATLVESELLAVRGLGPWSVNYLMMRGLGFADCVPVGDTGLSTALMRTFRLDRRPDAAATREIMRRFAPYRSLATFHLWLSLGDAP